MRSILLAGTCILLLGGCDTVKSLTGDSEFFDKAAETLGKVDDATAGNFAKGISKYCGAVPGVARKGLRKHVNGRAEMDGAKVGAWCPGDAPLVLGP